MKTFGKYQLTSIETGRFALDGGAMFGTVPKVLWDKQIPSDDNNRIEMALRTLLIQGNGKNILIDTGMGHKWNDKQQSMYNLTYHQYTLKNSLQQIGLTKDDITDVILTHLHFDHVGGATELDGTDIIPTFKNAQFYIQKKNLEWAKEPNEREKASYLPDNFLPLIHHNRLNYLIGEEELFPGIHVLPFDGHTMGMQCVKIDGDKEAVLYCADLVPTSAHIPLPWIMGYDIQPLILLDEKRKILQQAFEENWTLFFEHDPLQEACTVQQGKKYFERGQSVSF